MSGRMFAERSRVRGDGKDIQSEYEVQETKSSSDIVGRKFDDLVGKVF